MEYIRESEVIEDVDLEDETVARITSESRWLAFCSLSAQVEHFVELAAAGKVHATVIDGAEHWLQWEAVERSYRSFRSLYVTPRRRKGPAKHHDPALQRWSEDVQEFREQFYSADTPAEVTEVLGAYWKLRNKWHQKSPKYKAWKRKYQREYMARRRAAARATKAAT